MKRNTKQLLLEKGLELLMSQGFNNTGIQEVLKAVNVPKGSFYHYFDSKHDFGMQVLECYAERTTSEAATILNDPDVPPLQRLHNFFANARQKMADSGFSGGCFIGNLSQEMGDLCPEFQTALEQKWTTLRDGFVRCLDEARANGQLDSDLPSDLLADFLLNSWQGALVRMKTAKSDRPLEAFTRTVFERLVA